jgi:hypothetical protein
MRCPIGSRDQHNRLARTKSGPHCNAKLRPRLCRFRVVCDRSIRFRRSRHVRFAPIASEPSHRSDSTRCARSRYMHRKRIVGYSIKSSAIESRAGEIVRPSALAVVRLITSSNLTGACTGRSPGFSPRRIRCTYDAAPRNCSVVSIP